MSEEKQSREHAQLHVSENRIEHFVALTLSIAMLKAKGATAARTGDVDLIASVDLEIARCYEKRNAIEEEFESAERFGGS